MFDNEEDEFFDANLNDDISSFESYLNHGNIGFIDSDRLELIIDYYIMKCQYQKALSAVEFALERFSFNSIFKIRKAQVISALGNLKEALNIITQVEKTDIITVELLLTKASIYSQMLDHKNAIKYFKKALEMATLSDEREDIYIDLAMEYQAQRKFDDAIKMLKQASELNAENEAILYELAYCYDQLEKFEEAIQCYENFIDQNPYSFAAWYNMGNAYSKLEIYEKAITAYEYCVVINDDFGPVYFNLGNAYMELENYTKAVEAFSECIEIDDDDAMAYCYLGEAYEQLGQLDLAEMNYRKSLIEAPLLPDAWLGLGIVEDLRGNTLAGIQLILKASDLDSENASIYHVLASAYEKIEANDSALENFKKSLLLDPESSDCLKDCVLFLEKFESRIDILSFLENYIIEFGYNEEIDLHIINQLWEMGNHQEAITQFRQLANEDMELVKKIYDINSKLLQVDEFIQLTDNA